MNQHLQTITHMNFLKDGVDGAEEDFSSNEDFFLLCERNYGSQQGTIANAELSVSHYKMTLKMDADKLF